LKYAHALLQRRPVVFVWLILILLLAHPAVADNQQDLESKLRGEYVGKAWVLRVPYAGETLEFSADVRPSRDYRLDSWTVAGGISIEKLRLRPAALELDGKRIMLRYDPKKRQFHSVVPVPSLAGFPLALDPTLTKQEKKNAEDISGKEVAIRVRLPADSWDEKLLHSVLDKVFLHQGESLWPIVPEYWQDVLCTLENTGKPKEACSPAPRLLQEGVEVVSKFDDHVSRPKPLSVPDPEYSEPARKAKVQGTCVLRILVDTAGEVSDISILQPIGMGLDEKSVEAVRTWRFEPTHKDGVPVAAWLTIETSFYLY
jgi:TonB family protein